MVVSYISHHQGGWTITQPVDSREASFFVFTNFHFFGCGGCKIKGCFQFILKKQPKRTSFKHDRENDLIAILT